MRVSVVRRPSVKPVFSETVKRINSKCWEKLPDHISRPFFFVLVFNFFYFYMFFFFFFFFSFSSLWDHMGVNISNDISSESTRQIYSPKSCIFLGNFYTKVVERIVKFQIMDILEFYYFIVFVNIGLYGSKSLKRRLLSNNTPDLFHKIYVYSWGRFVPKLLKRIVKFHIFNFWHFLFLFLFFSFWPFNMVVNGEL